MKGSRGQIIVGIITLLAAALNLLNVEYDNNESLLLDLLPGILFLIAAIIYFGLASKTRKEEKTEKTN